ncbi:unnamed protein product [Staurois parvus]|uniref:Uncharacterized protein n=1 Tax=Staurois parvus TaxID=386267 RepID=A0ABN9ERU2_9NEOB|nr:unnamed protein product [Staurois parvus]
MTSSHSNCTCTQQSVPHQCHLSVPINATCQCPSANINGTYQCLPVHIKATVPIRTAFQCQLSVPVSDSFECHQSVPPISAT